MSNTTDWITAGAAVAGAVGTVGALWVGAVTLRRQVDFQSRDQASRVSLAKVGPRNIVVRNQSGQAIHGVIVWFRDGPDASIARYHDVPADTTEDVLPAGHEMRVNGSQVPEELAHSLIPYVDFTDAAGLRWRRGRGGELELLFRRPKRDVAGRRDDPQPRRPGRLRFH